MGQIFRRGDTPRCALPLFLFPFILHLISIKPVLSDHLTYVTIFHVSIFDCIGNDFFVKQNCTVKTHDNILKFVF